MSTEYTAALSDSESDPNKEATVNFCLFFLQRRGGRSRREEEGSVTVGMVADESGLQLEPNKETRGCCAQRDRPAVRSRGEGLVQQCS